MLFRILKILIACTFCLLIFSIGPEVQINTWFPLKSLIIRGIIIAAILLFWPIKYITKKLRAIIREKNLAASIFKYSASKNENPELLNSKAYKNQVKNLIDELRKCQLINGKENIPLHKLPWLLIVGPVHDGKTSIIKNSGLTIPLLSNIPNELQVSKVEGLNWYVTEGAVFLEYSRIYQDLPWDAESNTEAWMSILDILKKYKNGKPINSLIVTIDMSSFLKDTDEVRNKKIDGIRHYIKNLYELLEVRLPVYMVVTKSDQLAGFLDFFGKLSAVEQEQVVGFTLPLGKLREGQIREILVDEYDQFIEQLNARLIWLLDQERDEFRKSRLCFFPQQLLLLKNVIVDGIAATLIPNKFYEIIEFRGLYFTSAAPSNDTFCDPLGSLIVKQFDIVPVTQIDKVLSTSCYFLKNLYQNIIIPEANIVNFLPYQKATKQIKKILTYSIFCILIVTAVLMLFGGYVYNRSKAIQVERYINRIEEIQTDTQHKPIQDLLPIFNLFTDAIDIYTKDKHGWALSYQLYKSPTIQKKLESTLAQELENKLLVNIAKRFENRLENRKADFLKTFEIFKGYLVLSNPSHFPNEWLKIAAVEDWAEDSTINDKDKKTLKMYLDQVIKSSFKPLDLNDLLIKETMESMASMPLEQTIYNWVKKEAMLSDIAKINLLNIANKDNSFFDSNTTVNIVNFFSSEGFNNVYSIKIQSMSQKLHNDFAIINSAFNGVFNKKIESIDMVMQAVNTLYATEYLGQWDKAMVPLALKPFDNIDGALRCLTYFTDEKSSFNVMLDLINTNIRTIEILPGRVSASSLAPLLTDFVDKNTSGVPYKTELQNLYFMLSNINNSKDILKASYDSVKSIVTGNGSDPISSLFMAIKKMPPSMQSWYTTLTFNCWKVLMSNANSFINSEWRQVVKTEYDSIKLFYPISENAPAEISEQKFSNFFAKEGILDTFFNEYLKDFIDTKSATWCWMNFHGLALGSTDTFPREIHKLLNITDLYAEKSKQVNLKLSIIPLTLSPNSASVLLKFGDQIVTYRHGPLEEHVISWPMQTASEQIVISFIDFENKNYSKIFDGPWSLLKFINDGKLHKEQKSDTYNLYASIHLFNANFMITLPGIYLSLISAFKDINYPNKI